MIVSDGRIVFMARSMVDPCKLEVRTNLKQTFGTSLMYYTFIIKL